LILLAPRLSLPAGQTENRDGSGAENSEMRVFWPRVTRSTSAHFPRETAKKKGPETIRALVYGGGRGPRFNPSLRDYMQQNNQTCGRLLTELATPTSISFSTVLLIIFQKGSSFASVLARLRYPQGK
jgi:hypothetical protein